MIPSLIIITGLPCSGKTTVATRIAAVVHYPLISKDGIKERLFDSLGWKDRSWSRQLSTTSYDLLMAFAGYELAAGRNLIVEANFDSARHTPLVLELQKEHPFRLYQILCTAQGEVLLERFRQRADLGERHPGHVDRELLEELRPVLLKGWIDPLQIPGPLLEVDTTDFTSIDYPRIFNFLKGI